MMMAITPIRARMSLRLQLAILRMLSTLLASPVPSISSHQNNRRWHILWSPRLPTSSNAPNIFLLHHPPFSRFISIIHSSQHPPLALPIGRTLATNPCIWCGSLCIGYWHHRSVPWSTSYNIMYQHLRCTFLSLLVSSPSDNDYYVASGGVL